MGQKKNVILGDISKTNAEIVRLNATFSDMDGNMREMLQTFISNVAFMSVAVHELQDLIRQNGILDEYDNGGGQKGNKISIYVSMHQSYSKLFETAVKELARYVPAKKKETSRLAALKRNE